MYFIRVDVDVVWFLFVEERKSEQIWMSHATSARSLCTLWDNCMDQPYHRPSLSALRSIFIIHVLGIIHIVCHA